MPTLSANRAALEQLLHGPENLGIEFRPLPLPMQPTAEALAVFVRGLADEALLHAWVTGPLQQYARCAADAPLDPERLSALLPAPRLGRTRHLADAVEGLLRGATALFLAGATQAVLVETGEPAARPTRQSAGHPPGEVLDPDLQTSVALLRKRLRDPALVARPLPLPGERAAAAALVYLHDRVDPELLGAVERFARDRAGEEAFRRGLAAGWRGRLGLLPDLLTCRWPDKAAALLGTGHVLLLVDRLPTAYVAPVSAPAMLLSATDAVLLRPIPGALRLFRAALAFFVLLTPATMIALLSYHQEMMPTPFLFALAPVREQALLPAVSEIFLLEGMQELMREAGFHLPLRLSPGSVLVAGNLLMLLLTQAGVVGPLPAALSAGVALLTVGLLPYEVIYLLRPWRFAVMAGAAGFGFFGMATILFLLLLYLLTAESFGVPFLGESGLDFTALRRTAGRQQGGDLRARSGLVR